LHRFKYNTVEDGQSDGQTDGQTDTRAIAKTHKNGITTISNYFYCRSRCLQTVILLISSVFGVKKSNRKI